MELPTLTEEEIRREIDALLRQFAIPVEPPRPSREVSLGFEIRLSDPGDERP